MWGLIPLALSLLSKFGPLLTGPITQLITGINLNQVFTNVISALAAIIKFIEKHWRLCLIVCLAAGNVVGFTGWDHATQALKAEQIAHKTDVQSYKDAQTKANVAARAQEQSIIQESKVKANAADKNYTDLFAKYRANLLRYQTAQGSTIGTGQHQADDSTGQTSQGVNGPSESTDISITVNDAQICADNTARLQVAHDWAIDIQKGSK